MKKIFSKFFVFFMNIVGVFGSCFFLAACYGPPRTDYNSYDISGKVIKQKDKKPIKNIQVSILGVAGTNAYTNTDGEWIIKRNLYSGVVKGNESKFVLDVKDIDGPENGGDFKEKTVVLDLKKTNDIQNLNVKSFEEKDIVVELEEKDK